METGNFTPSAPQSDGSSNPISPDIVVIRAKAESLGNNRGLKALKKQLGGPSPVEDLHNLYLRLPSDAEKTHRVMTEENARELTGFAFSATKKWLILTAIFIVQVSMNFNAAIFGSAIAGLKNDFGLGASIKDSTIVRLGQFSFLVAYAFGCELWAPWSEELGRKWVLQGSLFFVNVWQIPCALSTSIASLTVFRALGGLSSAGGSVTLGMVADLFSPEDQQDALAYVVFSSCGGSVVAPIVGGFITAYLSWHWVFWISLIFGVVAQAIHFFVPETRSSIMLRKAAATMRELGYNVRLEGDDETQRWFWQRLDAKESAKLMWRPYKFLITEPIVGFLSLLSGFSDALIFLGLDSFGFVLAKWGFGPINTGLSFVSLLIGYAIAYACYAWDFRRQRKLMETTDPTTGKTTRNTDNMKPEQRLRLLLFLVVLEPIGLFLWGAASLGPPMFHWIAPLIFSCMIGIANFAIYMATIDYMVAAYGEYSASATGGNGFCRDFLAGIMALISTPFYTNIATGTKWQPVIPGFILGGVGVALAIPVYIIYAYGKTMREKSPFAGEIAEKRHQRKAESGMGCLEAPGFKGETVVELAELASSTPASSRENFVGAVRDQRLSGATAVDGGGNV